MILYKGDTSETNRMKWDGDMSDMNKINVKSSTYCAYTPSYRVAGQGDVIVPSCHYLKPDGK